MIAVITKEGALAILLKKIKYGKNIAGYRCGQSR
jgi:hypothetical protein